MRSLILTFIVIVNLYLICTSSIFYEFANKVVASVYGETTYLDHHLTPLHIILQDRYPGESHEVVTDDGYILTVYRIRGSKGSTPIYLQHGLLESAAGWLNLGKGKSLAYILADKGYDVWLGNARGNTFSKRHKTLNEADPKFWDFSWQELGTYDLPAVISYITDLTKEKIFYVGHSMGAITFSVMAVERPEVANKIKAAFALAPSTYIRHIRSPVGWLSYVWRSFKGTLNFLGYNQFMPRGRFLNFISHTICESATFRGICINTLFLMNGFSYRQLDHSIISKVTKTAPAGTSIKLFTHWLQQMTDNKLCKFDYGEETNLRLYNSKTPPKYDLSKINVPVAVFYSENDWLIGVKDAEQFYDEMPIKIGSYKVEDKDFNHSDFLWGVEAPELVYAKILEIMSGFDK